MMMAKSRFESLPTELRLEIYSLLLNGTPDYCHFEKARIGCTYAIPKLYPAILAVNRSISTEAYPVLYGENRFLFLGTTKSAIDTEAQIRFLSHRAGLPKHKNPPLLPQRSRHLIKHVAAAPLELGRNDWASQLLDLAPVTQTIEFDFWVRSYQRPPALESIALATLGAAVPEIKRLISASTHTFIIGTRDISAYHDSRNLLCRKKRVDLPGMQLAIVKLIGLDVQEKSRMVHKALTFIIEVLAQRPPVPDQSLLPCRALVSVGKRLLLHRDFAGFWCSDSSTVPAVKYGWIRVGSSGQGVEIGYERKNITWQRSGTARVPRKVLYGYDW